MCTGQTCERAISARTGRGGQCSQQSEVSGALASCMVRRLKADVLTSADALPPKMLRLSSSAPITPPTTSFASEQQQVEELRALSRSRRLDWEHRVANRAHHHTRTRQQRRG